MKNILFLILALISNFLLASGIETNTIKKGDIIGTVIDGTSGHAIEYATVALYEQPNHKLVTGSISDSEGFFRIKGNQPGTYQLTVTFMGFKIKTIEKITILAETKEIDLGKIILETNAKEIETVNVVADQASVQYKIDKKVVNVSQQLTAKSGTAVDILENVPSIKVDIEGNVSLRGSTSFTVLIDGRPTALDPSDALSQIPAGAIENIEIITNPSAKYEPDGTSGIINIITKKNKLDGTTGIINANVGLNEKYGTDFTLDFRKEKWHYYLGGDYNNRNMPGEMEYERTTQLSGSPTTTYLNADGTFKRFMQNAGINGGIDWNITEQDVIGINLSTGWREHGRNDSKDYMEWTQPDSNLLLYNTHDKSSNAGTFYSSTLDYKHTFGKNIEHYFQTQITVNGRNMDETSENLKIGNDQTILEGKKSTEDGPSQNFRIKLDYAQPFAIGTKLEAGLHANLSESNDNNSVFDLDTASTINDYIFVDSLSNQTQFTQNVFAGYSTFGGEWGSFGYQVGLRAEYTYWVLEHPDMDSTYIIDRPDIFPTLHLSYNLPADQQLMVSYSRRIERPRGFFLEPFITYMDANNVRRGNPGLKPEYINSFEVSYQKKLQSNFFLVTGYYRITQNKIDRVTLPYKENIRMMSFENIGSDYALGMEFMLNYNPFKWYTANLMADFYDYRMKGEINDSSINPHDFSWNARFNNTFKISMNTRVQIDANYQSASVNSQGSSEGSFSVNAAIKQDFMKRKASATLQVRDIFGTSKHDNTTTTQGFYQHTVFNPDSPIVMLTLTYKLNNYKMKNKKSENGENNGIEDDNGF